MTPTCWRTSARLLAEPTRTRILKALLGGRAFTGKELAYFAGVTAPTASSHLSRLVAGELLVMEKQGRCHYYRLKSADVARAVEALMTVAAVPPTGWPPGRSRRARRCGRRACATTTSPAASASRCATRCCGAATSCSPTAAARSRPAARGSWAGLASISEGARREAPVLPRVPRLDRAAPSHLGRGGGGARRGLPRAALDRAHPRQPRARRDHRRAQEARRAQGRRLCDRACPRPIRAVAGRA